MKKEYRWGILGAGRIAEKFCTALDYVEGAKVYAVASRDGARAADYAARYKAVISYDNYEQLMTDDNIDIIYIATPHAFHFEHTMACMHHNKAVLCEKPMSLGYSQTKEMIETATGKNLFLMEGMWTSCMPFFDKIKGLVNDGVIGDLQCISANFGFTAPVVPGGRLYNRSLGGGAMMDVGIYPLFLATSFLGKPSSIKTIAKISSTGIDEYTSVVMQYRGGETAQLLCSITFTTPIEAVLIGTKGRIEIKSPWFKATDFSVYLNDGGVEKFSLPHQSNGFEHEIMEVMECLDNGLIQSGKMPLHLTLTLSQIMEEILQQAGTIYDV